MTGVLHVIHGDSVEHLGAVVDDLEALLQRCRFALDITSTNQEKLVTWGLDVGKVVLEALLHID